MAHITGLNPARANAIHLIIIKLQDQSAHPNVQYRALGAHLILLLSLRTRDSLPPVWNRVSHRSTNLQSRYHRDGLVAEDLYIAFVVLVRRAGEREDVVEVRRAELLMVVCVGLCL